MQPRIEITSKGKVVRTKWFNFTDYGIDADVIRKTLGVQTWNTETGMIMAGEWSVKQLTELVLKEMEKALEMTPKKIKLYKQDLDDSDDYFRFVKHLYDTLFLTGYWVPS